MILYREYSLPLTGGKQQSVYQSGEVETWLGPLLRQASKLSVTEALKHQWKHRDSVPFRWLAIAVVIATVLIVMVLSVGGLSG